MPTHTRGVNEKTLSCAKSSPARNFMVNCLGRQRTREEWTESNFVSETLISPEGHDDSKELIAEAKQVEPSETEIFQTAETESLGNFKQKSRLFQDIYEMFKSEEHSFGSQGHHQ